MRSCGMYGGAVRHGVYNPTNSGRDSNIFHATAASVYLQFYVCGLSVLELFKNDRGLAKSKTALGDMFVSYSTTHCEPATPTYRGSHT